MHIRKAKHDDITGIMDIYRTAQEFMIASGNPNQWGRSYPSKDLITDDITNQPCYLILMMMAFMEYLPFLTLSNLHTNI